MPDWITFLIIFVMGAFPLLEVAANNYVSIFNRKIFKFLPIKHIFTAIAVVIGLASLIVYCVNTANRTASIILCSIGIFFLVVVLAIDMFIILKNAKHK